MPPRTIAIGDMHGCRLALDGLLEALAPEGQDQLVLLGDYVDRGPDSRGVIESLIELSRRCRLVRLMGNHEIMLLRAFDNPRDRHFWLQYGGQATVDSYGGRLESIPEEHLDFLRHCGWYHETDSHLFVHANYLAGLPLDQQPEALLLWTHLIRHLPDRHRSGKTAIVGHTPQTTGDILDLGHLICIDTFCWGGGWLTALEVRSGIVWQVVREGRPRPAARARETEGLGDQID
jgi:serine/threonine protein phosphatase 1